MTETIFQAVFQTESARHDRLEYFNKRKSLQEFMKWHKKNRDEIENETGQLCVGINTNIFINRKRFWR